MCRKRNVLRYIVFSAVSAAVHYTRSEDSNILKPECTKELAIYLYSKRNHGTVSLPNVLAQVRLEMTQRRRQP